jgi:raffinose/stachyose/melibiose transport system permease protein
MIGRLERRTGYTILVAATLIAALPLAGVVLMALGPSGNTGGTLSARSATHLGNFATVWRLAGFGQSLKASAIIAVSTVLIAVAVSVPAGYALATMRFRGRSVLFYLLLLGMLVPLEAMIVPLYFDMRKFGLTDSYWSVILPDAALSVAFGSFWMRAFFLSTPRSLVEAARLDGANVLTTLHRVLLPLARPQLTTLAVLVFVWTWNDFLLPLVMLSGSNINTAPISLVFFQSQHTTNYTYLAAAAIITVLPVVGVYVLLQRSFTRGMLSGALKG